MDFDQVTFTRSSLGHQLDRSMYQVEFYTDEMSYLYQIDGDNGSIYHREAQKKEHSESADSNGKLSIDAQAADSASKEAKSTENALNYIGVKQAQEIALADAGLTADQVVFEKVVLDEDDGRIVYDVHFRAGTTEYEYDIDASDGRILEKEMEAEDQEFSDRNADSTQKSSTTASEKSSSTSAAKKKTSSPGTSQQKKSAKDTGSQKKSSKTSTGKSSRKDHDDDDDDDDD
ncbi:MAG: PepSY domain-containing protein [Eubacterium sp.]|nr:PepSY domain-containing protein [Eubacterium sp.]